VLTGGEAKYLYRCGDRTFTGEFDDCFNDYIPILEVFAVPAFILITVYFFARFAFTLYAPPPDRRTLKWRLPSQHSAASAWPILQTIAAVGAVWALWRLSTYPLVADLALFHLYWAVFALWFGTGIVIGFIDKKAEI
jgi:hypothetical protein